MAIWGGGSLWPVSIPSLYFSVFQLSCSETILLFCAYRANTLLQSYTLLSGALHRKLKSKTKPSKLKEANSSNQQTASAQYQDIPGSKNFLNASMALKRGAEGGWSPEITPNAAECCFWQWIFSSRPMAWNKGGLLNDLWRSSKLCWDFAWKRIFTK